MLIKIFVFSVSFVAKKHLRNKLLYTFLLVFLITKTNAQTIQLDCTNCSLNEILIELNTTHNVQVSINANLSADCKITIRQDFKSTEETINNLAQRCNLEVAKIGEVYTFRSLPQLSMKPKPQEKNSKQKIPQYLYQGEILDLNSLEPLPFTTIQLGNRALYALSLIHIWRCRRRG